MRKNRLAWEEGAALGPNGTGASDLAESPPGTVEPYVRPNVIISVDDSGSMKWKTANSSDGAAGITTPNADGTWHPDARRMNILKHSLKQVFSDTNLLPDKKIRLSWQTMWNNGGAPDAASVDSTGMNQNSMRVLESVRDAQERQLIVHKMPIPGPLYATEEECAGVDPVDGSQERSPHVRLAGAYINFLIVNGAVLMPAYGDPADAAAAAVLAQAFPGREIVPVPCRPLIWQNGSLHCITMQLPEGLV